MFGKTQRAESESRFMASRPYPYDRLVKFTHRQLALHAALRAACDEARVAAGLACARGLLGMDLTCGLGDSELGAASAVRTRLSAARPGLVLQLERDNEALPVPWLLELSAQDAQAIVDRALGGDEGAPASALGLQALDELSSGALAYVVARVLAAIGGELKLSALLPLPLATDALPQGACLIWPVHVRVADQQSLATLRLYIPEQTPFAVPASRPVLRTLDDLPLTLIAVAGRTRLPLTAAKALERGDVVLLDDTSLQLTAQGFGGEVTAGVAGSEQHILCSVTDSGLCIDGFSRDKEAPMTTGRLDNVSQPGGASGFASDVTVELKLEVARFAVTLADLQRLQVGDVLASGRRIGERVSLSASGQLFAEGELVDVEGELGIKILAFTGRGT